MNPTPTTRWRIGLALGSGVARGWAHIGVLRALLRAGIVPDVVAGTSIGAVVGGLYLAGRLDALEHWARSLTRLRMMRYLDLRLQGRGMLGGTALLAELRREIGALRIEELARPFVAVTTDLVTGHEVWLRHGDLADALRASYALPGVFPPVPLDGRFLVDGALVDPLPVAACRALGAEMVIAVNLNADLIGKGRRTGGGLPATGFEFASPAGDSARRNPIEELAARLLRRSEQEPTMFGAMMAALNIMQDRITRSRLAGDPPDVHIVPRLGQIGLLEFDRADEAIGEGELAVARARPELADALRVLPDPTPRGEAG